MVDSVEGGKTLRSTGEDLPAKRSGKSRRQRYRILQPMAFAAGLDLIHFDGGVEMRVRAPNKGDAVRAILREHTCDAPTAYLGDDVTDEDTFAALNPIGLTVLVGKEQGRLRHSCGCGHRPNSSTFSSTG